MPRCSTPLPGLQLPVAQAGAAAAALDVPIAAGAILVLPWMCRFLHRGAWQLQAFVYSVDYLDGAADTLLWRTSNHAGNRLVE